MMREDLISAIQQAGRPGVLAVTGGGSEAIGRLLAQPGASATVLEAIVPYSEASLVDWLGHPPARACDEATARAMAMRAFDRAGALEPSASASRFGLGCTASLATDRPKKGDHRAHVAVQTATLTTRVTLRFEKGQFTRAEEEAAVAHAIVATLADAVGVHRLDLIKTPPGIEATQDSADATAEETALLLGQRSVVALNGAPEPGDNAVCLLPGSFNPPHEGHAEIARLAGERTGRPVVAELSLTNVDKPPLDFLEVRNRVARLQGEPVWLTRSPTFVGKSELAPGTIFAVGADTAERIADARYYGDDPDQRDAAIQRLADRGCRFLVFGRLVGGQFQGLDDLKLTPECRALSDGVTEAEFRIDQSSTAIRNDEA